jgi:hypothetical protein
MSLQALNNVKNNICVNILIFSEVCILHGEQLLETVLVHQKYLAPSEFSGPLFGQPGFTLN